MSHRPHAYVSVRVPTHGGNPPNTFVPQITAEVRVYWTPTTTRAQILDALRAAYDETVERIDAQPNTFDRAVLRVGVDIDSTGLPL